MLELRCRCGCCRSRRITLMIECEFAVMAQAASICTRHRVESRDGGATQILHASCNEESGSRSYIREFVWMCEADLRVFCLWLSQRAILGICSSLAAQAAVADLHVYQVQRMLSTQDL